MKKTSLLLGFAAIACAALSLAFVQPSNAGKDMTREEIEQIVHDYIVKNPVVILTAVDQYQRQQSSERSATALSQYKSKLFGNDQYPVAGAKDGDISVVEFFDFNCGYCKHAFVSVKEAIKDDAKVKFIFVDFPILGPTSELASRWALAAQKQGKYFEYHAALMGMKGGFDEGKLEAAAKDLDLDIAKMKEDVNSKGITEQIAANRTMASQLGITGTPGFVIEDELFPGAIPLEQMKDIISKKRAAKAAAPKDEKAE